MDESILFYLRWLAGLETGHPFTNYFCVVSMMSTATTLTSPNAVLTANTIIIETIHGWMHLPLLAFTA